uniref:Cytosolic 5'-nucleotidase 1A n=3 Tax=Cyprinus carpio TaxID=7962 RepID=A0A8C1T5Y6_CYPCA
MCVHHNAKNRNQIRNAATSILGKQQKLTMTPYTIAVSQCALFRQETGYIDPGDAFPFVKALTMVNQRLSELGPAIKERFKIVLIPTNSQDMDPLKNSIENHNLNIDQICEITGKKTLLDHLNEIKPVLYLSTTPQNVKDAINEGFGAATLLKGDYDKHSDEGLRVAFDGDGVLFSDDSEKVTKEKGLEAFFQNEIENEDTPLKLGPLRDFFKALAHLQELFKKEKKNSPIRTYLVTSRATSSPGIRALKSLRENNLEINEAFFLSGAHKGPVLKAFKPHIFFDDYMQHVKEALHYGVIGAHVPYGVRNE